MTEHDKRNPENDPAEARQAQRARDPAANRSETLLPGDDAQDGRYDVAEEVNLDQQSDQLRRVGQAPAGIAADALPEALKDGKGRPA